MALIFQKTPSDKVLILGVRESATQPFQAPDWLDLRIGMFLSLTKAANDDDPTGLAEAIVGTGNFSPQDNYWIGVKDNGPNLPGSQNGVVFIGFGTGVPPSHLLTTHLVSSDIGIGTTNAFFWRPYESGGTAATALITDGIGTRGFLVQGVSQHFPQDPTGAGGYCVLLGLRLTRPSANSNTITALIKTDGLWSADMLYSNAPTEVLLQASLDPWPTQVHQIGPVTLSSVPTALFCYWPFHNSRLRIHSWGIMKVA